MIGGKPLIDEIQIGLRGPDKDLVIYINIFDNTLSRKWLPEINRLLQDNFHLEKNYCFLGFADSPRNGEYILAQVNASIQAINAANIGYKIDDWFCMSNALYDPPGKVGRMIVQEKLNRLHRYFEDLQGVSGNISTFYTGASPEIRWHIRQLNLLCHEFESWALSYRKEIQAPEWRRPSQLMCWLNAPRFVLDEEDYELFGIQTLNRPMGGVFVGVNKAVGKHHWEVYMDEGKQSRIDELTTTSLRSQTEASGDFDIEWANDPGNFNWQQQRLQEFRQWLIDNKFDPDDKMLTIGHPQIGQIDLDKSFGSQDYQHIWRQLSQHLDVHWIRTSESYRAYDYHWTDADYAQKQIDILKRG